MPGAHDLNPAQPNAEPASLAPRTPRKPRRRLVFVLLTAFLVGGIVLSAVLPFLPRRSSPTSPRRAGNPPSDPRLIYDGPFGNIHPDVAYLSDDSRCLPCHTDICTSYRQHPMGRSLTPIAALADREPIDTAHQNPFRSLDFRFTIERDGPRVWHRVTREDAAGRAVAALAFPVHFVIGSGTRGRSYLSSRDGYLFQTPISWFAQKQIWDLSPGFSESSLSGRPVPGRCVFCHANRANFRDDSINHYDEPVFSGHAIGCERCHGPAERHLQTLRPLDIVNPKRLTTPALRNAVCEQCHLKGQARVALRGRRLHDFRPGLPLSDFAAVFVAAEPGGESKAVSHVEQMHASRCYQNSAGEKQMGCVSCHDPHRFTAPSERAAHYRQRCLRCHETHPCSLAVATRRRQQPNDSCIACHMPRFGTSDIVHTAITDHRLLRRPSPPHAIKETLHPDSLALFHPSAVPDKEFRRALAIAFVQLLREDAVEPQRFAAPAVQLLENALVEDADDVPAWHAKGTALMKRGRLAEALAAFESALSLQPRKESCLAEAAEAAQLLDRLSESQAYWKRAIETNPWRPGYRARLTALLIQRQAWEEAKRQCAAWRRLEPWSSDAALMWITCLLHEGDRAGARAEFARLEALRPPNLEQLKTWFDRQIR
jgi:hypothetical protein